MTSLIFALIPAAVSILANIQAGCVRPVLSREACFGHAVAAGLAFLLASVFMLLSGRPWFSMCLELLICWTLWYANRVKVQVLGEPLVITDVFLFGQAVRHPHLYVSHVPAGVRMVPGLLLVLVLGLLLGEAGQARPLGGWTVPVLVVDAGLVSWAVGACALCRYGRCVLAAFRARLQYASVDDAAVFTPLGAAMLHLLELVRPREAAADVFPVELEASGADGTGLPHVLLVQAESYCDMSRFDPHLVNDPVTRLDLLRSRGQFGRLQLFWRGAYTMRTEFSVLTGRDVRTMGPRGFDPYHLAVDGPCSGLAPLLRRRGYRTVCVHPYDRRFFNRHTVLGHLGFDEFIDESRLQGLPRSGPYISDEALLETVGRMFGEADGPLFVFVITMEAHGPWMQGRFDGETDLSDRDMYLRHMASLNAGLENLVARQQTLDRPMVSAVYGDHLPSLDLLRTRFPEDKATDYVLWSSGAGIQSGRRDIGPEDLAGLLLRAVDSVATGR